MSKPHKPAAHPYDNGRESLRAAGGGLFGITLNTPTRNGAQLGPWKGEEIKEYRFSPLMTFPEKHYTVHYISAHSGGPQWFVKLKGDTTAEERIRLAEVFMDLINTQRVA